MKIIIFFYLLYYLLNLGVSYGWAGNQYQYGWVGQAASPSAARQR